MINPNKEFIKQRYVLDNRIEPFHFRSLKSYEDLWELAEQKVAELAVEDYEDDKRKRVCS